MKSRRRKGGYKIDWNAPREPGWSPLHAMSSMTRQALYQEPQPSEIKVIPFRGSLGLNTVDLAMAFLAELHGIR